MSLLPEIVVTNKTRDIRVLDAGDNIFDMSYLTGEETGFPAATHLYGISIEVVQGFVVVHANGALWPNGPTYSKTVTPGSPLFSGDEWATDPLAIPANAQINLYSSEPPPGSSSSSSPIEEAHVIIQMVVLRP